MDKVHENHDHSVKDEIISEVSGGKGAIGAAKVTARASSKGDIDILACPKCGSELYGAGDSKRCPKCGVVLKARGSIR